MNRTSLEKLEFNKVLQFISNYCETEKGKNDILSLSPLKDIDSIKKEGDIVNQARNILIEHSPPPFEYIPDLSKTFSQSRVEGTVLESKKILQVLNLAVLSRKIFSFIKSNKDLSPLLEEIASELFIDKVFEHHIQKVIDENGDVRENASPKLKEIRKEIRSKKDELVKSVNRIVKSLTKEDITREEYITLRDGRIVIPIKAEHKRHIRGFIHSESASGQTVYIEPEQTLELNNEIISLSFAEKREIDSLLQKLTKKISSVSNELNKTLSVISYIDTVFAKAHYSIEIIGSFPEINNEKPFYLADAKHPILLKKLGKGKTVPLNLELKENKIIVITGPNAGGKTVVLKNIGLLTLLVNTGIHIPASPDSNFHFFEKVLMDIGDEQSIEDDLSTFSSHLSNTNEIISSANKNSLVLLDEIGTGTDPAEGSALATAVLISLRDKGATVFATTHHGSLKLIANELDDFENAAMEFDNENLEPTYRFKQGIPGSSYAFEIARRIGLKDDLLSLAEKYLDQDKHEVENFLVDLEAKQKSLQDKLRKAEIENTRLSGLSNLYKQQTDKLNREKKDILKKAKEEADEYLKDINKKFEQIVKEVKESTASKETIKTSKNIIQDLKEKNKELFKETVEPKVEKKDFEVGDFVLLKNTNTGGEVVSISKEKSKATITAGSLKMQVSLNELEHAKKPKEKSTDRVYSTGAAVSATRIDIRGDRPEEAEFEVVKYLDDAYTSGLNKVEILHGKGTGALKKTVNNILKNHDKVVNYYFAPVEFGGDGITIAELK